MPRLRSFLAFLATLWGAGAAILIVDTFSTAYAHGGSILVEINAAGEMWVEIVALGIVAPIFAVGLFYAIERFSTPETR